MDDVLIGRAKFSDLAAAEQAVRAAVVQRQERALLWWSTLWAILRDAVAAWRHGITVDSNAAIAAMGEWPAQCRPEVDTLDARTLVLRIPFADMRSYVDFAVDAVNDDVVVSVSGDASAETGRKTRVATAYFATAIVHSRGATQLA